MSERWWMNLRKQHLPETIVSMITEKQGQHATDLHKVKPDKMTTPKRSDCKVPPLTKKLFAIVICLGKENQCSPVEHHWVYWTHSE